MRGIVITAFGAILCLSAPVNAELLVNVSKSQQRLSVVIDGTEAYRWPVSTGARGHATPTGSFRPERLERHWYSHQYKLTPMPWAMFFHRGYAVHGTAEAYNLGHATSHGCVRLRPDKAAILFSLMRREGLQATKVVIMNGPLPAAPGDKPMADGSVRRAESSTTSTAEQFAKALAADEQQLSAKAHSDTAALDEDAKPVEKRAVTAVRASDVGRYRVSSGHDEGGILRERQAWLRAIDRKYGIGR